MTASLEVVSLEPTPDQWRWSFGGGEPLLTVVPGTVVELTTEDCYAGEVRGVEDLPSVVCRFPYLNPVTGPIAVEGAEPATPSPCTWSTSRRPATGRCRAPSRTSAR